MQFSETLSGNSEQDDLAEPPTSSEVLEATRYLWRVFEVTHDWIKNSDTKAAAVLSANAILANAAVQAFGHVSGFNQPFLEKHPVVLALDLLALVLAVTSVAFSLKCIAPKIVSGVSGAGDSLIYFGHIARRESARAYEEEVRRILTDEGKALNQISDQVWISSRIVTAKLTAIMWSVRFFAATLLVSLIAALAAKVV